MTPYHADDWLTMYVGDCRTVMASMEPESIQTVISSPPYFGLRDYGLPPATWGGDPDHDHEWGASIVERATNHTDKRRWQHTRNGRDEEQPTEKRVAWLRTDVVHIDLSAEYAAQAVKRIAASRASGEGPAIDMPVQFAGDGLWATE